MSKPAHPAIAALRAAHEEFRRYLTARGETTHICYDSDLRIDERTISTKWRDEPLIWTIGSSFTQLQAFPDAIGCYVATRRAWEGLEVIKIVGYALDAYRPNTLADGGIRSYVWDGRTLHRMASTDELWQFVCGIVRNRAVGHLEGLYPEAREDLANAREGQNPVAIARHEDRIAGIDRDIAIAKEWGPSGHFVDSFGAPTWEPR